MNLPFLTSPFLTSPLLIFSNCNCCGFKISSKTCQPDSTKLLNQLDKRTTLLAITFAEGFYDGLTYENLDNQNVFQTAFEEGLIAIVLEDFSSESIPVLKNYQKKLQFSP